MKKLLISIAALLLTASVVYLTLSNELDKSNQLTASVTSSEQTRSVIDEISSYEVSSEVESEDESETEVSSEEESSLEQTSKPTTVNSLIGMPEAEPEYIEDNDVSSELSDDANEYSDKANTLLEKYESIKTDKYTSIENEQPANTKKEENKFYKQYSKGKLLLVYGKYIYNGNTKCYLDEYNYYYDNKGTLKCTKYYFKEDYTKDRGEWADSTEKYYDDNGLVELKISRYDKKDLLKLTTYQYDKSGNIIKKYVYGFNINKQDGKEIYTLKYVNIYNGDQLIDNYKY